jgi:hypothetical protein
VKSSMASSTKTDVFSVKVLDFHNFYDMGVRPHSTLSYPGPQKYASATEIRNRKR